MSKEPQLMNAVKAGNFDLAIKIVEENPNINLEYYDRGRTVLDYGIFYRNVKFCSLVIGRGANQHNHLRKCIIDREYRDIILFYAKILNLNKPDNYGHLPLEYAIFNKDKDTILALLAGGARMALIKPSSYTINAFKDAGFLSFLLEKGLRIPKNFLSEYNEYFSEQSKEVAALYLVNTVRISEIPPALQIKFSSQIEKCNHLVSQWGRDVTGEILGYTPFSPEDPGSASIPLVDVPSLELENKDSKERVHTQASLYEATEDSLPQAKENIVPPLEPNPTIHNKGFVCAGLFLMEAMNVRDSIMYLWYQFIPKTQDPFSYVGNSTVSNFLHDRSNEIAAGAHLTGGLMFTYGLFGFTHIGMFVMPVVSSASYLLKEYAFDYKQKFLSSFNSTETSYLAEVAKLVTHIVIDVVTTYAMSAPFVPMLGNSLSSHTFWQGGAKGVFSYFASLPTEETPLSTTVSALFTLVVAAISTYKISQEQSIIGKIAATATAMPIIAMTHLVSKKAMEFDSIINKELFPYVNHNKVAGENNKVPEEVVLEL